MLHLGKISCLYDKSHNPAKFLPLVDQLQSLLQLNYYQYLLSVNLPSITSALLPCCDNIKYWNLNSPPPPPPPPHTHTHTPSQRVIHGTICFYTDSYQHSDVLTDLAVPFYGNMSIEWLNPNSFVAVTFCVHPGFLRPPRSCEQHHKA